MLPRNRRHLERLKKYLEDGVFSRERFYKDNTDIYLQQKRSTLYRLEKMKYIEQIKVMKMDDLKDKRNQWTGYKLYTRFRLTDKTYKELWQK